MDAYVAAMKRYVTFGGRAGRREFWMFVLIYIAILIFAAILDHVLGTSGERGGILQTLVVLAHLPPGVAVAARRLHDVDMSGWWQLVALIPVLGLIMIYFFAKKGNDGANRFGAMADPIS